MQILAGHGAVDVPSKDVQPTTATSVTDSASMDVDDGTFAREPVGEGNGGAKRKAGEISEHAAKKLRMGTFVAFAIRTNR